MKARKIALSWIVVSDLKKSVQFFTEVLGLELKEMHEEFSWAELGGEGEGRLGIAGPSSDKFAPGCNAVVTFTVDDIAEARASLQTKGVALHGDVMEVPGIVKLQTFSDKDGNIFQLAELLNS